MLKSLKIENFRCFEEFKLSQLGRVNLLVGKNNSGKTSILEAIHILEAVDISPFWEAIERRKEYLDNSKESSNLSSISHFCFGHDITRINDVTISDNTDDTVRSFRLHFSNEYYTRGTPEERVILSWDFSSTGNSDKIVGMSLEDSFSNSFIQNFRHNDIHEGMKKKSIFIALSSSQLEILVESFNEIVLTPQEEILYDALRFIEPGIQRIASSAILGSGKEQRGGFVVAIDGKRIPIGSMGDGIWRMLEITLAMVNIPGGTLLIDEIDTGLHFSVMLDLWRLIFRTAEKLDIQVFATTHSSDCWKSLAEVAQSDEFPDNDITIHRIERGKKASVAFNKKEMAIAAERDIEVR
jgi:AAA15 family ATPase/GTPase